ncbi:hypothetical protein BH23GEM9_BH23GEM9_20230 [soil metagenome]
MLDNEKHALIERAILLGCTLDGAAARIAGAKLDYATVSRLDGNAGDVQFSWSAVAVVLRGDRNFKSTCQFNERQRLPQVTDAK